MQDIGDSDQKKGGTGDISTAVLWDVQEFDESWLPHQHSRSAAGILREIVGTAYPTAAAELLSLGDRDEILGLISQMRDNLSFLRDDLTADERRTLLGMGDKNRIFAGKVLEVIQQSPEFLPRSFDIAQFQQDLGMFDRLSTILMALTQLRDLVDATTIAIGSEAFENALTAYRHAKASGQGASLEAMMADMGQRFARKGKKRADEHSATVE